MIIQRTSPYPIPTLPVGGFLMFPKDDYNKIACLSYHYSIKLNRTFAIRKQEDGSYRVERRK